MFTFVGVPKRSTPNAEVGVFHQPHCYEAVATKELFVNLDDEKANEKNMQPLAAKISTGGCIKEALQKLISS